MLHHKQLADSKSLGCSNLFNLSHVKTRLEFFRLLILVTNPKFVAIEPKESNQTAATVAGSTAGKGSTEPPFAEQAKVELEELKPSRSPNQVELPKFMITYFNYVQDIKLESTDIALMKAAR